MPRLQPQRKKSKQKHHDERVVVLSLQVISDEYCRCREALAEELIQRNSVIHSAR